MEKGWDAKGLLRPLWAKVGGRDALAALTGITPQTLSAYNSGKRPLGIANARRIALALEVSVLELGAPSEEADGDGLGFLARLEAIEEAQAEDVVRLRKDLNSAIRRIRALERRFPGEAQPTAKKNGKNR